MLHSKIARAPRPACAPCQPRYAARISFVGARRTSTRLPATRVPSTEAAQLLQQGLPYLDVRTPEEFAAGHAVGAVNVPFWFKTADGMVPNPDFLKQVKERFPDATQHIVVGCRSGNRSAKACTMLEEQLKYGNLTDDEGGWMGWVDAQLPTEM